MNYLITNSEINSLGTFNTTFMAFLQYRLNLYSTSDDQGCHKNGGFNASVQTPSLWKTNQKTPGLSLLPSQNFLKYQIMSSRGK